MCARTPDSVNMQRLFVNTQELARGPQKKASDLHVEPRELQDYCSWMFRIRVSMPGRKQSHPAASKNREVLRDGTARTGGVFADMMDYISKVLGVADTMPQVPRSNCRKGVLNGVSLHQARSLTGLRHGRSSYIHTYTFLPTYVRTYVHTYIRAYIHTSILPCIDAYRHTCIHACMHACMHVHIHIHT